MNNIWSLKHIYSIVLECLFYKPYLDLSNIYQTKFNHENKTNNVKINKKNFEEIEKNSPEVDKVEI